jgi:hypothetical protein
MNRCRPIAFCTIGFALLWSLLYSAAAQASTIDMVTVGNPGNAPDTRYPGVSVGSVNHVCQIGKYEVTAGQHAEFLNVVAKADPNGLYNPDMGPEISVLFCQRRREHHS